MFWDKIAGLYDFFMTVKNGKVNRRLCTYIATLIDRNDRVLECACGTGMISEYIADRCFFLTATDFSDGMLKQTKKKCARFHNIIVEAADITKLKYADETFDKVVASNVIHLLEDPLSAISELYRVCKPGGKVIIPTYINNEKAGKPNLFVKTVDKLGADFREQFTYRSYQAMFVENGYSNCRFDLIQGSMPCAIAIIAKGKEL